jgi:hypothetical protein
MSGKLSNFKWRVGVALSSNKCKNLSSPYVLVSFDICELNGSIVHHACELSFEEFKVRFSFCSCFVKCML